MPVHLHSSIRSPHAAGAAKDPALKPFKLAATSRDPGISAAVTRQGRGVSEVTFKGQAAGPREVEWGPLGGAISRSVEVDVALDEAPTKDAFGRTDYSEKNARGIVVTTERGMPARKVAEFAAKHINDDVHGFKAQVVGSKDGSSARLIIRRDD